MEFIIFSVFLGGLLLDGIGISIGRSSFYFVGCFCFILGEKKSFRIERRSFFRILESEYI